MDTVVFNFLEGAFKTTKSPFKVIKHGCSSIQSRTNSCITDAKREMQTHKNTDNGSTVAHLEGLENVVQLLP